MVRLVGLEPTTSAFAGLRSNPTELQALAMVPRERFELSCPCGHYALNVARLPFRHLGDVYKLYRIRTRSSTIAEKIFNQRLSCLDSVSTLSRT